MASRSLGRKSASPSGSETEMMAKDLKRLRLSPVEVPISMEIDSKILSPTKQKNIARRKMEMMQLLEDQLKRYKADSAEIQYFRCTDDL
jgi:hypothetical protein